MNQSERRTYLIKRLLNEKKEYANMKIPANSMEQKTMLRSLMNMRMPGKIDDEFLKIQDEYLQKNNQEKDVVTIEQIERENTLAINENAGENMNNTTQNEQMEKDIFLWQGDITRLKVNLIPVSI